MKKLYHRYLKNNLGLINLAGKTSGRVLFLLLTSFFAYKLSVEAFASFAIFWTTVRMFTFVTTNNLNIVYFNEVRNHLLHQKWLAKYSANLVFTMLLFSVVSSIISYFIFQSFFVAAIIFPILLLSVIIRYMAEFSKADNSLFMAIFVEDFLFYFLFFIAGVVAIYTSNSFDAIILSLFATVLLTTIVCAILFKRKFNLQISSYSIRLNDVSITDFKLGIHYTIMRGTEFFSNFGVRFLGLIYFGEIFVSYAHIMYQFYNVFMVISMSVISGLQSKITVSNELDFHKIFVKNMYLKVLKTVAPFTVMGIGFILIFNAQILSIFFPKYVGYNELLMKVSLTGFIFMFIQPLIFILIYNNKVANIKKINLTQYLIMFALYLLPWVYTDMSQQYWLLMIMTSFILIQGLYSLQNYKTLA